MCPELRRAIALVSLVLACGLRASADEFGDGSEAASLLLSPDLRSDQARATEAVDLLDADRRRKFADLSSDFVDLGIQASLSASPIRLLRAAGRIGRGLRDWDDRLGVEDEALALLAPGVRSGDLDASSLALYTRLERRESEARVAQLLADAERAFGAGDLRRTRRTVDRALSLSPGSSRADRLLDALDEREWQSSSAVELAQEPDDSALAIEAWQVQLGTALLVDDFERAQEIGPSDSRAAEFARATARYLEGDRNTALAQFRSLARGDDAAGQGAAQLLADPSFDPASEFDAQLRRFRARRALGWMGGPELAAAAVPSPEDALSLSRDGVEAWETTLRAWRETLSPVNLVIDAPARAWRSWQPAGRDLHDAAQRYLELSPQGEQADAAAHWLDRLAPQLLGNPRVSAFSDGMLLLPRSRTAWTRSAATRIVVARAALLDAAPVLGAELAGDAPALLLALARGPAQSDTERISLSSSVALDLLADLARGIEQRNLEGRGERADRALSTIRALDARVRGGGTLVVQDWSSAPSGGSAALESAFVDHERAQTVGEIELERRDEDFLAERSIGGAIFCPRETACIDLRREFDPTLFAMGESGGALGVGARASFDEASVALELGTFGPRASFVIPVARWLGISRYFPVEARLAVGLGGISAEPQRRSESDGSGAPDPSF